jgi:hypothetical protein
VFLRSEWKPSRRWIICVMGALLVGAAGQASAAWERLRGDGVVTVWADPAKITRSTGRATMWSVINYTQARKMADGREFLSSKQQIEYDCVEARSRHLAFTRHADYTGWGEVVYTNNALGEWAAVPPGSIADALRAFACRLP